MSSLAPNQIQTHRQLVTNYPFFARHIQKIEPKDIQFDESDEAVFEALWRADSTAGMVPFILRPGQNKLHEFCEQMKREVGYIAAALVKPRQVGWSTYIQGRAHWLCTKVPGLKVLIVSHTRESTGKFLRRIRKMCSAAPDTVTPGRPLENTKEIGFANGAYISVATAGSPDAVRSDNAHFFHGSEETSWENEVEIGASIFPALSFGVGSEAFRETTSKGKNTPWHRFIQEARAGQNRWRVFFDPYFNDPRYRTTPPAGWEPDAEAREHALQHLRHLTPEEQLARLYWRNLMIKDLRALWLFKQEYPSTIDESFQASEDTLYKPDAVYRAQANFIEGNIPLDPFAPLIMGVDPARDGDRTVIVFRQGNIIREVLVWPKMEDLQLAGIIAEYLNKGYHGTKIAKCFIDYAIGEGVASILRGLKFHLVVQSVHFGESASEPRFANKRAEMYMNLRDWLGDTGEHVAIAKVATLRGNWTGRGYENAMAGDMIAGDLLAMPDFLQTDISGVIKMPPKKEVKKLLGMSPDIADACVLTFAYPVAGERPAQLIQMVQQNLSHLAQSELMKMMADFERR